MQKFIGATFLIAGTCIGSGMIALPMVLAKIGIGPSLFLMSVIWGVMYVTSLANVELNLWAGKGLPLGALAKKFSGKKAQWVGVGSLKLLSYALMAVFIYGAASVLQKMIILLFHKELSLSLLMVGCTLLSSVFLLFPLSLIDYVNRFLFIGLIGIFLFLMGGLLWSMKGAHLPWVGPSVYSGEAWRSVLPVVFTSFGFQVIFHTLTEYCRRQPTLLKKAFFWGSLLPALLYSAWVVGVLGLIFHQDPLFYEKMAHGKVDVGDLVERLAQISSQGEWIPLLVWGVSILAIVTSILGVGVGLVGSWDSLLQKKIPSILGRRFVSVVATMGLPAVIALGVPQAFISILGFAGMILAVIAILLPLYLFYKNKKGEIHYPLLKIRILNFFSVLIGVLVILCEFLSF